MNLRLRKPPLPEGDLGKPWQKLLFVDPAPLGMSKSLTRGSDIVRLEQNAAIQQPAFPFAGRRQTFTPRRNREGHHWGRMCTASPVGNIRLGKKRELHMASRCPEPVLPYRALLQAVIHQFPA